MKYYLRNFVIFAVTTLISSYTIEIINGWPTYKNTHQLITDHGYTAETHTVETEDGFFIDIFRIPYKKGGKGPSGPPVILQHGMLGSSESWVIFGPGDDLAFLLAEEGFDVWLSNCRGNPHGRQRGNQDSSDFSFEEMGYYDMAAVVDYVTSLSSYHNVSYVGHSMGTTYLMVALSLRPDYVKKVNYLVGMAPNSVFHPDSVAVRFSRLMILEPFGELMSDKLTSNSPMWLRCFLCSLVRTRGFHGAIVRLLNFILGKSPTNHAYFVDACVFRSEWKTFHSAKHNYENAMRGKFMRRNFGPDENLKRYNTTDAPLYNLSHITTPTSFYFGNNDNLVSRMASVRTAALLPNLRKLHSAEGLNHFDIIWPQNSSSSVFRFIIEDLVTANKMLS